MRSAKLIFGLSLALSSSMAQSENWRVSSSGNGAVAYIDTDSIQPKGDRVRFWRELRWPEPQLMPSGTSYDRLAGLFEADCRARTLRSLRNRLRLGTRVVFDAKDRNDAPDVMKPGSNGETDLRAACFNEWKSGK